MKLKDGGIFREAFHFIAVWTLGPTDYPPRLQDVVSWASNGANGAARIMWELEIHPFHLVCGADLGPAGPDTGCV